MIDISDLCHLPAEPRFQCCPVFSFRRSIMPNQQDVLDALGILSEEVLESLRFLSYMLFTMTRTVQPEEGVTEAEMTSINHLVAEVRSQKAKITELGRSYRNASCKVSPTPVDQRHRAHATMGLESWEIAEVEAAEMEVPVHGVRQNLF